MVWSIGLLFLKCNFRILGNLDYVELVYTCQFSNCLGNLLKRNLKKKKEVLLRLFEKKKCSQTSAAQLTMAIPYVCLTVTFSIFVILHYVTLGNCFKW